MNRQHPQYVTEQVEYQAPSYDAPTMEGYDPTQVAHDAPYIPQNRRVQQNPYQQPQQMYAPPKQMDYAAINQQQMAAQQNAQPTYHQSQQNFAKMSSVVQSLQEAGIAATADGSDVQQYALGAAMDSLYTAIKTMSEVDYWIPAGKEHLVPKLTQVATPIIKALQVYVNALEKIK